jgi:glutamate-ammonia-ligase adenylyltransferase
VPRDRWEDTATELTSLAEGCLRYAVEVVQRESRRKKPPFAVFGLGKFGGAELSFGSDLDLFFLAPSHDRGVSRLPAMAARVMDLLSRRTESGFCFDCDARLRPYGEKGLLVTTFNAATDYYERVAGLWELQALSRARWVAGDAALGQEFLQCVNRWTDFSRGNPGVAAWTSGWIEEIGAMQQRIARERTPPGQDALAFKTGTGGLVAAEFLAQTLGMSHGWREPNTLCSLERAGATGALSQAAATEVITGYRALRRWESILRRWSFHGESVLPVEPAAQLRVARRCGFSSADALLAAFAEARQKIGNVTARPRRLPRTARSGSLPTPPARGG